MLLLNEFNALLMFSPFYVDGTTRSQDTDTPDESGVGESIISNESPAESRACGGGIMSNAVGVIATMNSITPSGPCQVDWRLNVVSNISLF